jgi:ribose transport system substrate-binding protein
MSLRNITAKSARVIAGLAAASLVATVGMTASAATAAPQHQALKNSDLVMVVSVINTTNPYMAANIKGAQVLSKKLGIPLKIVDSQGSSQTEISKIQAILAGGKKVVMFVNTVASSDTPTIVNAVKAAGGFVSIWWNKPDSYEPWNVGNNFVAFQKHSGVSSGECTADMLAKAIGKKGNIIALPGVQDSTTSQTRVAGLEYQLATKYPNVKILEEQPSGWDPQLAYTNTKALITKYGSQIDGVWTADDGMQDGAIQAFKEAGLLNKVKFVSDGLYPETIANIKNNIGGGAIVGETFHRGWAASAIGLYTAYLAATGKIDPSKLPHEKRDSMFNIACVTPQNYTQFTKYDANISGWVDSLIKNGPWNTAPFQLAAGGPEKLPTIPGK